MLKEKKYSSYMFRELRGKWLFSPSDFTVEIMNYGTSFPQCPLNTLKAHEHFEIHYVFFNIVAVKLQHLSPDTKSACLSRRD